MCAKQRQTDRPGPGAAAITILITVLLAAAAGAGILWITLPACGPSEPSTAGAFSAIPGGSARVPTIIGAVLAMMVAFYLQWRIFRVMSPPPVQKPATAPKADASAASAALREKRLFVYLFNRLQRDGRLMDFLAENLEAYEDAQIGAAARSVHAGCRQVVEKLLAPRPVLDGEEEARLVLGADYDARTITLTGRVGDHPPFEGIVRHTGWKATRIQIPLLAEETDAAIIAPAEVEVG